MVKNKGKKKLILDLCFSKGAHRSVHLRPVPLQRTEFNRALLNSVFHTKLVCKIIVHSTDIKIIISSGSLNGQIPQGYPTSYSPSDYQTITLSSPKDHAIPVQSQSQARLNRLAQ